MSVNPVRICLWSGPRNISTATMRSFEARGDCAVWDEPFYGYYLDRTGVEHPGRAETLALWPTDPYAIADACAGPSPDGRAEFFQKHMCQHILEGTPLDWTRACKHIFLIRDPAQVAASFAATVPTVRAEDLGVIRQAELYAEICALTDTIWPVVEGSDILDDPERMLRAVCDALGIGFTSAMLRWPEGRRATDGPWAPWWYQQVEDSTGFAPNRPSPHQLPSWLDPVVEACQPSYLALRLRKLRAL